MNEQLTEKKSISRFVLLMSVMYMVSYLTRTDYGVVIADMVQAEGMEKSLLSVALTGSFFTYGVGQLVSGYFGDRIQPKKLLQGGLAVTILMNLLIPFCKNPYQMAVVWCVNGFAQAFMWPPMVKMMSAKLSVLDYERACLKISIGALSGTLLLYLASPILIALSGWRTVFFAAAGCGIVMSVVWQKSTGNIDLHAGEKSGKKETTQKLYFPGVAVLVFAAVMLQGLLRDGVSTWMPSYISETYHLSSSISILTGMVLPIFSILCQLATERIYHKKLKNPMLCAGAFFLVGCASAFVLSVLGNLSPILSVFCSAVLTGCMHGVNLLLVSIVPGHFRKYGHVSMFSGLMNSGTYIGSAVSSYGFAKISEMFGWSATIAAWTVLALLGAVFCFVGMRQYQRKILD